VTSGSPPSVRIDDREWAIVSEILQRLIPDYSVWVFGSRAGGEPKPYSDLDLAIDGPAPLALDRFDALREAFSESPLPWKVDILDLAVVDEGFRRIIERARVQIQEASSAARE
jgi:predicted nucleotidyltransferase